MNSYKEASNNAQKMEQQKVTFKDLSKLLNIEESLLNDFFKLNTPISLGIYLEICGALKLRPYLVPSEIDTTEMQRFYFN